MKKIRCNDLQPGVHIRVTKNDGTLEEHVVRKMIPIQPLLRADGTYRKGDLSHISDIEILLDKSKNTYFSYGAYLRGESWVKNIEILS